MTEPSPRLGGVPAPLKTAVSEQTALVFQEHEIRTLTEIGFLAAGQGHFTQAEHIFLGLSKLRPQKAFPFIGLAVTYLNQRLAQHAVTLLQATTLTAPQEHEQLQVWLGFALQQAGSPHAAQLILQQFIASSTLSENEPLQQLARGLLAPSRATPSHALHEPNSALPPTQRPL
ncbi:tetratricopeptide repeat protein [Alcaligenes endophyticus]|uniref:Uncharacterized protein n=1 Tax=Alcaligenes endophyticus TaxID=1929088 RepID=A0ABT8EFN8_9BURK|nr:hypothetical protein [Alcaligenes endophyticus]MCX5590272.1 hypothetical protein [Alcaligenes endophyticus]MDN4120064.1 hypothetical protein [Alcaligenes endophyticus]